MLIGEICHDYWTTGENIRSTYTSRNSEATRGGNYNIGSTVSI